MTTTLQAQTYRGYTLDPFQVRAMSALQEGKSALVCAPTGAGKTLIAEFALEKCLQQNERAIYTSPLKALSNQKFRDFCALFGESKCGIVTGDVVVRSDAPLIVMTTEVFRNQCLEQSPNLSEVGLLVLDEIHYIDSDRGSAWEESVIFGPPGIRVLGLSATVKNAEQLRGWISKTRNQDVALIVEEKRPVPLEIRYYSGVAEPSDFKAAARRLRNGRYVDHIGLIDVIRPYLPCLYFTFSRAGCERKAEELSHVTGFLSPGELDAVERELLVFEESTTLTWSPALRLLARTLRSGVAFHHAGLLPAVKELVENLFARGLVKVLYCTETFAVGVNYPARSVCFDSLRKFDGKDFRPLKALEFFQMAGRAGRRGMDAKGYVFACLHPDNPLQEQEYREGRIEPLRSQFTVSYNTALNLIQRHNPEEIRRFLLESFASYLRQEEMARWDGHLSQARSGLRNMNDPRCNLISDPVCPIRRAALEDEMRGLRRNLKRGKSRPELTGRLEKIERILAEPAKGCDPGQQAACHEFRHQTQKARRRIQHYQGEIVRRSPDVYVQELEARRKVLEKLDYTRGDEVLPRGEFAARIHVEEILVTELVFDGIFSSLSPANLCGVLGGIGYDGKGIAFYPGKMDVNPVQKVVDRLAAANVACFFERSVCPIVRDWARGKPFPEILAQATIGEGDLVSLIRRTIDLSRQVLGATGDPSLKNKLRKCMVQLDRDEVRLDIEESGPRPGVNIEDGGPLPGLDSPGPEDALDLLPEEEDR